jgi:hypothetical protein
MKKLLHSVIDYIVAGLLKIQSGYQPKEPSVTQPLLYLTTILEDPISYAEISEEALNVLYEEASIAASEIVSPNSYEWEEVRDDQFEKLQHKFWAKFVIKYHELSREGRI